jgi:F420H(2)-dependent biliverdin reductase
MASLDPLDLSTDAAGFLCDRHLATLTTVRPDGTPHVVAVGFTWDPADRVVRVITREGSKKVRNIDTAHAAGAVPRAVVCQVDGGRWLALEGPVRVARDATAVAEGERRYAGRYQDPRPNPERVVIEISVDKILGRA